jgi:predicted helicase
MRHMLAGENLALIARRQMLPGRECNYMFVSEQIISDGVIRSDNKGGESLFPLYLYPDAERGDMFGHHNPAERRPNLNPKVVEALKETYGREPTPEEILYHVYAVLYAPTYRKKYAEFLRIDFPRIPFTSDRGLFTQLAELGGRLVDLHLLRSSELDPPIARFQGEGDVKVVASGKRGLRYDAERQRVYINADQHFEGVPPEVWAYQIGGYQVCHKWLKDRKSRKLTLDEIRTYCRIATALAKTIEIQKEIDALYPAVEENLLSYQGEG